MTSQQSIRRGRRKALRFLAAAMVTALTMAAAPVAAAAAEPGDFTGSELTPSGQVSVSKSPTSRLAKSDPAVLAATTADRVPLLVKLDYDSVATYAGGVQGLQPTSPEATDQKLDQNSAAVGQYEAYAAGVEDRFTSGLSGLIPGATVGTRLRTVYGGVAVTVPANRAKDLLSLPGVVAVQADPINHLLTDSSPAFIGATKLYSALRTDSTGTTAGQGVIVGVLDSGVWPEHPSFTPNPSIGAPPAKADGTPRVCNFGDNPLTPAVDPFVCTNKLISGEAFLDTYAAAVEEPEVYGDTARDSDGHGTHTSTTAAGSPVAEAKIFGVDRGPIHGIAPGAYVAAYKVCGLEGCFGSDTAAAVQQAVIDGVDVINYSISGGAQPFTDATELAFLDAYAAGVFVAASAGNSGPGAGTTDHHGPWVTTVAASTQKRNFESTLTVTAGSTTFTTKGASITAGVPDATPVVLSSSAPYNRVLCDAPAPAGIFAGKIVACQRGGNGRVEKGFNVLQGGAVGMILYNPALADVETDNHFLPTVHLADGTDFLAFMTANPDASASFTAGEKGTGQGDVMAAFSSRGPGGDWLKPDVTAPGVEILAGNTPTPESVASGPPGQYYQAIAGTSMSSPHVAGSAALIAALHPRWTPGQIKSALMTTAKTSVVKEDLETPADPFDYGSGRIDLTKAGDPGLTFDVRAADFAGAQDDSRGGVDLNLASINVPVLAGSVTTKRIAKNVTDRRVVYRAVAKSPAGSRITVAPSFFTLRPGQTVGLSIRIDGVNLKSDEQQFGQVLLDEIGGRRDIHLPVAFKRGQGDVALSSTCAPAEITLTPRTESTCSVTATNSATSDTTVDISSTVNNRLRVTSIDGASSDGRGGVRLPTTSLVGKKFGIPAIAPGASPAGYLPLSLFGFSANPVGDESLLNVATPPFEYAGETYTAIGATSNGYLVVGGGTAADIDFEPQTLPDPVAPNNVLAPFWTDLDGTGAPGISIGSLTDGVNSWLVVEWQVFVWGTTDARTFQAWIGLNGTEDISYTYDPTDLPAEPNGQDLTVGAENADGSGGAQITGLPTEDLRVASTPGAPGGSASYEFTVRGTGAGTGQVLTTMTSPDVIGKAQSVNTITVKRR